MVSSEDVRTAMAEVADLQQRLTRAFDEGDAATADRLMAELQAAERRRNRALQRAMAGTPTFDVTLPVREQVARVLGMAERPVAVSLVRDIAAARFGDVIPGPRLASLRRDEQRSWRSSHDDAKQRSVARPVYVVPALTYDRLAPVRGVLALSSWPLEVRLLAPASPRVDVLAVVERLATELAGQPDASWAPEVERLLWRLARTVPGAVEDRSDLSARLDTGQIRRAAEAELAQIADADAAERAAAARRARSQLDEEQQLFGSRLAAAAGSGTATA